MLFNISLCGIFSSILDDIHYLPKQIVVISYQIPILQDRQRSFCKVLTEDKHRFLLIQTKPKSDEFFKARKTIRLSSMTAISSITKQEEMKHFITFWHCMKIMKHYHTALRFSQTLHHLFSKKTTRSISASAMTSIQR